MELTTKNGITTLKTATDIFEYSKDKVVLKDLKGKEFRTVDTQNYAKDIEEIDKKLIEVEKAPKEIKPIIEKMLKDERFVKNRWLIRVKKYDK